MERQDLSFCVGADSCAAWFYRSAGHAPTSPVIVMGHGLSGTRRDRLGPFAERFAAAGKPGPAIAAARRAPLGELRTYPGVDHFDIYEGSGHEAVVTDEVDFLRRHLLGAGVVERPAVAAVR